ncbi:hypothetical protein F5B20DRAFT_588181 [Whalleya microplaca]|nr:hypothetical protein F5B20DRAFT_588181 [Whalleya microplaca]
MWWFLITTIPLVWGISLLTYVVQKHFGALVAIMRITNRAVAIYMVIFGLALLAVATAALPYVDAAADADPAGSMFTDPNSFLSFWLFWYVLVLWGAAAPRVMWLAVALLASMLERKDVRRLFDLGVAALGAHTLVYSPIYWANTRGVAFGAWAARNLGRFEMAWFKNLQIHRIERPDVRSPAHTYRGRSGIFWKAVGDTSAFVSGRVNWTLGKKNP